MNPNEAYTILSTPLFIPIEVYTEAMEACRTSPELNHRELFARKSIPEVPTDVDLPDDDSTILIYPDYGFRA